MLEKLLLQRVCYLGSRRFVINSVCSGYRHLARKFNSGQDSVEKYGFKKKNNLNFPEKTVNVYSCENIYDKWKKERTFKNIPKSGVYATIRYIDTFEQSEDSNNKRRKTVLCIHGIPGYYGTYDYLINALSDNGIRVIVPTFPQILYFPGKYQKELFRHTLEEKTQLYKDFLKAIKVSEVDCIIAHSSGIYPTLQLMRDPEINGKCQIFFNTCGHKPSVAMRPYCILQLLSFLYLTYFGRIIIQKIGKPFLKYIIRSPLKGDAIGISQLALTVKFSQLWKTEDIFEEISKKKTPTLYIFSEDDKAVEKELSYQVVSKLGASKENVNFYDEKGKLQKKGKNLPWLKLLSFQEGSHYVFRKYPEICNQEVLDLLRTIKISNLDSSENKS